MAIIVRRQFAVIDKILSHFDVFRDHNASLFADWMFFQVSFILHRKFPGSLEE